MASRDSFDWLLDHVPVPTAQYDALCAVAEAARALRERCVRHEEWQTDPCYLQWNATLDALDAALARLEEVRRG